LIQFPVFIFFSLHSPVFSFFSSCHSSCSSQSKVCASITNTETTDGSCANESSDENRKTQSVLRLSLIESCEQQGEEVLAVKPVILSCRSRRSSQRRTDNILLVFDKINHVIKWSASLSVRLSYPSEIRGNRFDRTSFAILFSDENNKRNRSQLSPLFVSLEALFFAIRLLLIS
jgi:hypothetical protein